MAAPNSLLYAIFVLVSFAFPLLGVPVLTIPRALAPDTGALALLAGNDAVISSDDARSVRRECIGTTSLSVIWWLINGSNLWPFVFGDEEKTFERVLGEILGNGILGHFVFPLCYSRLVVRDEDGVSDCQSTCASRHQGRGDDGPER